MDRGRCRASGDTTMKTKEEYLKAYGIEKEVPPLATPPQEKPAYVQTSVDKMRENLEIKKLQMELEKLEKPDTSIDYYSKMLELQEKNFGSQIEMLKQQGNLQLEIEKLKLGNGDDDNMLPYLQMLAPLLPEIVKKSKGKPAGDGLPPLPPGSAKEEEMEIPKTAGELEEYKKAVQRGEISLEEAYEDFLSTPWANSLSKDQFELKFNAVKNEKNLEEIDPVAAEEIKIAESKTI